MDSVCVPCVLCDSGEIAHSAPPAGQRGTNINPWISHFRNSCETTILSSRSVSGDLG
jgi:hypothetical protein